LTRAGRVLKLGDLPAGVAIPTARARRALGSLGGADLPTASQDPHTSCMARDLRKQETETLPKAAIPRTRNHRPQSRPSWGLTVTCAYRLNLTTTNKPRDSYTCTHVRKLGCTCTTPCMTATAHTAPSRETTGAHTHTRAIALSCRMMRKTLRQSAEASNGAPVSLDTPTIQGPRHLRLRPQPPCSADRSMRAQTTQYRSRRHLVERCEYFSGHDQGRISKILQSPLYNPH
jgi:hypothetical protein